MLRLVAKSDNSRVGGIQRFEVKVDEVGNKSCVVCVEIFSKPKIKHDLSIPAGEVCSINIHLHLLPAGKHKISFRLKNSKNKDDVFEDVVHVAPVTDGQKQVRKILEDSNVPVVFEGFCDSAMYPYERKDLVPWYDRDDALDTIASKLNAGDLSPAEAKMMKQFVSEGYIQIDAMVDNSRIDLVNKEIDQVIKEGYQGYEYGSSQRIELLHQTRPEIRKLWNDREILALVSKIFADKATPCQTLTYVFGSQQDAHQDTIHLTPFPAGYMCGIWVALQDIDEGSGELVVYPGSHREPRVYMAGAKCSKVTNDDWSEFGETVVPIWTKIAEKYEKMVYRPKKGTVLIWHENLLHGGSTRKDESLERRALVIHAFAEKSVVYYDSSGEVGMIS